MIGRQACLGVLHVYLTTLVADLGTGHPDVSRMRDLIRDLESENLSTRPCPGDVYEEAAALFSRAQLGSDHHA